MTFVIILWIFIVLFLYYTAKHAPRDGLDFFEFDMWKKYQIIVQTGSSKEFLMIEEYPFFLFAFVMLIIEQRKNEFPEAYWRIQESW